MDKWDLMINWDLVLPPSRPSKWQLDWISSYTKEIDFSLPVAILGSTPEFRDHLHELGFKNIYVFDKNLAFYRKMSATRIYQNEEVFVHGDWLETLSDYTGFFSMILSDLTSGNIEYDSRSRFYALIANALAEKGVFCDKILTHPSLNLSINALSDKYAQLPMNLTYINYFSCEMLFCSDLLDIKLSVDTTMFYNILWESVRHPRVKGFIQKAQLITPMNCHWYYGKKWSLIENDYCHNLKRIDEEDDSLESPYFGRVKFFVHQKE